MGHRADHNCKSHCDYGTYHIGDQRKLRLAFAVWPEPSLFAHMKYGSRRRARPKTSSPTGWLRMRIWRIILRWTKTTIIISWAGSILACDSAQLIVMFSEKSINRIKRLIIRCWLIFMKHHGHMYHNTHKIGMNKLTWESASKFIFSSDYTVKSPDLVRSLILRI